MRSYRLQTVSCFYMYLLAVYHNITFLAKSQYVFRIFYKIF